jgi:hypothetical protein
MRAKPTLPNPPELYDPVYMQDLASLVVDESVLTAKIDRDNVFERGHLILKAPAGGFHRITVNDAGTLSTSAVTVDADGRPITSGNPYV